MGDTEYQEGKYQEKKAEKPRDRKQEKARETKTPGKLCPACGAGNPPEAKFCGECGTSLDGGKTCPRCGTEVPPEGDVCEVCGTWLLGAVCKFCYTPLPDQARFCPDCGNPREGITCPSCGTVSYFDFCPSCHSPLSEAAGEMREAVRAMPGGEEYLSALEEAEEIRREIEALEGENPEDQLGDRVTHGADSREAYPSEAATERPGRKETEQEEAEILENLKALEERVKAKKGITSASRRKDKTENPSGPRGVTQHRPQEGRRRQQEKLEEKRKRLKELKKRLDRVTPKLKHPPPLDFSTAKNQEIRRYFMAIKPPNVKGWLCNAFNALHEDPMHCVNPAGGGRWILEED